MNKSLRRANLKLETIATEARVSITTVSRVLNNKGSVGQKTRERVLKALKEKRIAPAKKLIGMIVPDHSNPFFAELAFTFEGFLEQNDAHLVISSSEGKVDRELEIIEQFKGLGVEGLIFISAGTSSDTLPSLIADPHLAVVMLDRWLPVGNLDFVAVDSRQGTQIAVDYLVAYGHSRIGYLRGLHGTETAKEREESFRCAMAKNGLEVREAWVFEGDYMLSAGRACAERLIALGKTDRPTALLAANDLMAIGAMQRLQQERFSLPSDLSIIGFDNILWSEWVHPALTTIAQPIAALVAEAVRLLLKRIESDERLPPRRVVVEPTLIPRKSVGRPRDERAPLHIVPYERSEKTHMSTDTDTEKKL